MIEQLRQDLTYAARTFTRAPGFAIVAVLTIAIGVGANAAIFSVVNATLLRPLPFPDAGELVLVSHANKRTRQPAGGAAPANFLDWRIRSHAFAGMTGFREASLILSDTGFPERQRAAVVNTNFFDILKLHAAVGRTFLPEEEGRGSARVAVIADSFWRERFGKRLDIVGQTVRLDDEVYAIVGVMAPGVDFPGRAQVWITPHWTVPDDPLLPSTEDPSSQRGHTYFSVLARLKPGTTIDAAAADMDGVAASLERVFPDDNMDVGAAVERLRDELIVSDVRATTLLLFAAVGLLLLIAAANVSGLLMARATARQQEISLRAALGATRGRILAQLLTESVLLATIGGGAGVLLAMVVRIDQEPDGRTVGDIARRHAFKHVAGVADQHPAAFLRCLPTCVIDDVAEHCALQASAVRVGHLTAPSRRPSLCPSRRRCTARLHRAAVRAPATHESASSTRAPRSRQSDGRARSHRRGR